MHSHIWKIAKNVAKDNKLRTILMVLTMIGSVIGALIPPLVLGNMIDRLTNHESVLLAIAFTYLLTITISGVLQSLQNIMITMMGQKVTHEMRSSMSRKLQKLPTSYFTKYEAGAITSRFVNDVDAVDSLFTNGIISMIADAFQVVSILIVIFIKSKGLGVIMCIVTPLLFWMTMVFQKRMRNAQIQNRKAVARVNHHVPETIENIRMVHTFSCEHYMEEKYDAYIETGYQAMDQSNQYDSIYSPMIIFIGSMVIAVMMVLAAKGSAMQQFFGISIGSAVAMIAYVGKVFDPLESLGMEIQNIQSALAGVERIDEFLNEDERNECGRKVVVNQKNVMESKTISATVSKAASKGDTELAVQFEHVSFLYEDGKEIISDMSFVILKNQYTLLTGRTGAGKSTIFKLLLGLYEPSSGNVWIEERLAHEINPEEKRRIFGYVPQAFDPIEGTIADQIRMMDDDISEQRIWNVLEQCGLKEKIMCMPENIHTEMKLKDFSQGELQLLSIARAMVTKPEIMLLDEMTANLDSNTEQKILQILQNVSQDTTVISISHRLAEKTQHQVLHIS